MYLLMSKFLVGDLSDWMFCLRSSHLSHPQETLTLIDTLNLLRVTPDPLHIINSNIVSILLT